MTDPRETPAAPPPGPWWSRPAEDEWGAPATEQPAYGTTSATQAGPTPPPPVDPWSRPTTQATFPSGAQAWGYPTDTLGGVVPPPPKKDRRGLGTAALVLATALVAGALGGVVGARTGDDGGSLLDSGASLGGGGSTTATVDRAPDSVAGIAAKVMQSTVSIAVQGAGGRGTGSGVIIRSDGYILTNNHVVESAASGGQITVTLDAAEGELSADIVGRDPVTDLAVLRVRTDRDLPAASLGQSRALVVGDPVIAIGSPLGLSGTVTTGIVSALNRTVDVPSEDGSRNPLFNAIQTDAAINPGNSGGALVNARGEVIGINSAIATLGGGLFGGEQSGGSIGVGFAIPIDEARSVAEEIIRTGRATHPSIGVSATTVSGEDRDGALIRELTPGGGAGRGGLEPGDLIVAVDGQEISSVDELILAIRSNQVGDTVELTYLRDGRERTASVELQDLRR
ncbi:MAG: PDZ domain-containing protein [Frankiales bacterium]|nr:MAG: PDZ domain-containing protein [Frankiales bacterium]